MQQPWRGLLRAMIIAAALAPAQLLADVCHNLSAELARIERSIAGGSFSEASRRQHRELASARTQKSRCNSTEHCASLAALVASMETNLATLEHRARLERGDQRLVARRNEISKRLQAAQCRREAPAREAQANAFYPTSGLLAWLGQGAASAGPEPSQTAPPEQVKPAIALRPALRAQERSEKPPFHPRGEGAGQPHFSGSYRTLCVRSCDGYYWPVSYQTSSGGFQRDAETCRSACPGSEVALYVHRNPGASSDDAVSLRGRPYTALKTAYRFRREFDAACTCKINNTVGKPALAGDQQQGEGSKATEASVIRAAIPPEASAGTEIVGDFGLRGSAPPQQAD